MHGCTSYPGIGHWAMVLLLLRSQVLRYASLNALLLQDDIGWTWSLPVDATAMFQDSVLTSALPDLAEQLRDQPVSTLNCMALAFHTVCMCPPSLALWCWGCVHPHWPSCWGCVHPQLHGPGPLVLGVCPPSLALLLGVCPPSTA